MTRSKPDGRGDIKSKINVDLITINEQNATGTKIFKKINIS